MGSEKPLSERQKSMLHYIWNYMKDHERPPTIREIGTAVKISSTSVVNYNLTKLSEKNLLDREADVSRGLRLTDKAIELLGGDAANALRRKASEMLDKAENVVNEVVTAAMSTIHIPLLGNIVAGEPINVGNDSFRTYDEEDAVELSASMLPGKTDDLFALRVNGDSMIDAMVQDGDIVIMRKQEVARNGDMVAVWLTPGDTTTLKYFFHEGDRVRLQPANPTMLPIYVRSGEVRVQGKVMMVIRQTA